MNDQIETDEKQINNDEPARGFRFGVFFITIAIIIFICGFGYGFFQLSHINVSLAQMVTNLQTKVVSNQNEIRRLTNAMQTLEQASQKSQDLSTQQEQLMAEWRAAQKGDLNKWQVAEAQYLVKLANDHLQFSHNVMIAKVLLQQADQLLQNNQDAKVLDIRKTLAADLANLQTMPQVDITSLYLKIAGLNDHLDQLSLPLNSLKLTNSNQPYSVLPPNTSWWKAGLTRSWEALSKVVIVRYNGNNGIPLVLPEEKNFLYQNLHAQMENALWAVLHRNAEIYQASLIRVSMWIKQYFAADAPLTQNFLQSIADLQKINVRPETTNLATTLDLFTAYFAQTPLATPATDTATPASSDTSSTTSPTPPNTP